MIPALLFGPQGEFLDAKSRKRSGEPNDFNTIDSSNKMLYIWLSDFTLNSAGRIYHEAGRLKHTIAPSDKSVSLLKF